MEQEQLEQIYISFAVGFFSNNYTAIKETDLQEYDTKLKRLFRALCHQGYGFNPIAADYMTPDVWLSWTWKAMQLHAEIVA